MNALSTTLFFVFSALALAGGLAAALTGSRRLRGGGVLAVGLGLAGLYAAAGAGYAGAVALVGYTALGALFAYPNPRSLRREPAGRLAHQAGAVGAAALLLVLGYAALRGGFSHGPGPPGAINAGDVGRLLVGHEALALEAVAALLAISIAGAAYAWWGQER